MPRRRRGRCWASIKAARSIRRLREVLACRTSCTQRRRRLFSCACMRALCMHFVCTRKFCSEARDDKNIVTREREERRRKQRADQHSCLPHCDQSAPLVDLAGSPRTPAGPRGRVLDPVTVIPCCMPLRNFSRIRYEMGLNKVGKELEEFRG